MAVELRWSVKARQDLLDIYVVVGLDSPASAERLFERLSKRAISLIDQPRLGPKRDDIRPNMRMLVERPYLLLYEIAPDIDDAAVARIDIVRIVDGRRDLAHAL